MKDVLDTLDIIIVGGGISGVGTALEAKRRGYRVLLMEQNECCQATSNNSLRIIHGGFRYLQYADILRVIESYGDQQGLIKEYSQYIQPLPCLMPLTQYGFKSRYPVTCASVLYRGMARFLFRGRAEAGYRAKAGVEEEVPLLRGLVQHGALYWQDALLVDPAGFSKHLKGQIKESVLEQTKVTGIEPCGDYFEVTARDQLERSRTWRSRAVVNATGPWVSALHRDLISPRPLWCKAFNVILRKQYESTYAIGFHGDRRLYFLVPREHYSVLGTEYIECAGNPADAKVEEREIETFVESFNHACPAANMKMSDVTGIETGVLPMKRLREGYPQLYGKERIYADGRYMEVLSTKFTTFPSLARKVLKGLSPILG